MEVQSTSASLPAQDTHAQLELQTLTVGQAGSGNNPPQEEEDVGEGPQIRSWSSPVFQVSLEKENEGLAGLLLGGERVSPEAFKDLTEEVGRGSDDLEAVSKAQDTVPCG